MMTKIQAEKIAAAVNTIRPDWDITGITAALGKARNEGEAWQVAIAAIAAAANTNNRTPAVLALPGEHWRPARLTTTPTQGLGRRPRCTVYGHESYPADNCAGCRIERLTTPTAPEPHGRDLAAGKD